MKRKSKSAPKLHVIDGGLYAKMSYKNFKIIAAPVASPPFKIDAVAYEEDIYLIMSADPETMPPSIHPLRLMSNLAKFTPETPGTVVVSGANPLKFLAVVHDVDCEPTWREEWIEKSLVSIFAEARQRRIRSLGLPLLGTKYGKLKHHRFIKLLAKSLQKTSFENLVHLWLMAPAPENADLIKALKEELNRI